MQIGTRLLDWFIQAPALPIYLGTCSSIKPTRASKITLYHHPHPNNYETPAFSIFKQRCTHRSVHWSQIFYFCYVPHGRNFSIRTHEKLSRSMISWTISDRQETRRKPLTNRNELAPIYRSIAWSGEKNVWDPILYSKQILRVTDTFISLDHYSTITQRFRPFYNLMPACHFINIFQREADIVCSILLSQHSLDYCFQSEKHHHHYANASHGRDFPPSRPRCFSRRQWMVIRLYNHLVWSIVNEDVNKIVGGVESFTSFDMGIILLQHGCSPREFFT
mgnify:CR=1 FL=1